MSGTPGWLGSARAHGGPGEPASDRPTAKQLEALHLVYQGLTFREMQARLSLSAHAVECRVQALVKKGFLSAGGGPGVAYRYKATAAGLAEMGLRCCPACSGVGAVKL